MIEPRPDQGCEVLPRVGESFDGWMARLEQIMKKSEVAPDVLKTAMA